jgi:hypothetical protein
MGFLLLFLIFLFGAGMALLAYYGVIRLPEAMMQRKVEERLQQIDIDPGDDKSRNWSRESSKVRCLASTG